MAFIEIKNVSVRGVAAAVPKFSQEVKDLSFFTPEESERFSAGTGVERRRLAQPNVTAADLCFSAAENLIEKLNWEKSKIDCLIFVTQTPDYILPATSCILQDRLKLSEDIVALDISLGCSGWVYGLMTISNLLSNGSLKRGLLLVGDTISKTCSTEDKSTYPLFGDAGTATALEYDSKSKGLKFHLATDGSGASAIIIPDGGYRNMYSEESLKSEIIESGIFRNPLNLVLDGMNVFSFGISKAPKSISSLLNKYEIDPDSIDYYLFHQANLFMNEKIRKKLKIPAEKVPYSLKNFGNTSSATIPLTIVNELGVELRNKKSNIVACGFGVGLSWGTVSFSTENLVCPGLLEI